MSRHLTVFWLTLAAFAGRPLAAQQTDKQLIEQLLQRLADDEARIQTLESRLAATAPADAAVAPSPAAPVAAEVPAPVAPAAAEQVVTSTDTIGGHDHMMEIPGGPTLHFRGFLDFDFDTGAVAQNFQYPLGVPATSSFRTGEFDLFMTSQLSPKLSFLAELVIGTDPTNNFEPDLERYELTYKASRYFAASAGRYHTAIGYYNTAYHHGTWFATATGRPFMYYFEDSGGVLPVHEVGLSTTGAIPSGKLDLHWIAEIGNGQAPPGANFGDGVESFASNRNHKDLNFAVYSRPEWLPGLQIGGSYLTGDLIWTGVPKVNQTISSAYVVFIDSRWEFMNEAVLMHHQLIDGGRSWNSPMGYTQIAYRIASRFRPYFRFQEVNIPDSDPVSAFVGRYEGPSAGLRWDVFDYAALKLQYNRVFLRDAAAQNGMETALAFTF